jgi:hypothetical protein
LPDDVARRVQFPITEKATGKQGFSGNKWMIRDIPEGAQTEIEWLQPYNRRPDDPTRDKLWVLNELANIDKHRVSHLTLFALTKFGFGGTARFKFGRQREAAAVVDSTKLFCFGPRLSEPRRKVDVQFNLGLSIALAGPIAEGAEVFEILRGIRNYIMDEVLPRLAPYLPSLPLP